MRIRFNVAVLGLLASCSGALAPSDIVPEIPQRVVAHCEAEQSFSMARQGAQTDAQIACLVDRTAIAYKTRHPYKFSNQDYFNLIESFGMSVKEFEDAADARVQDLKRQVEEQLAEMRAG